jgi:hypothetical protein
MLNFALAYWDRNFSFIFWGELKKLKSPFEINWPLVGRSETIVEFQAWKSNLPVSIKILYATF